jgi:hypothetical protein
MNQDSDHHVELNSEQNSSKDGNRKNSDALKVGLGVAAVAATGIVAGQSLSGSGPNIEEVPVIDAVPEVDPSQDLPVEPFTEEHTSNQNVGSPIPSPEPTPPQGPDEIYVHKIDEFGNVTHEHYVDTDGDGKWDTYEIIDNDGNIIESGNVTNISTDPIDEPPFPMDPDPMVEPLPEEWPVEGSEPEEQHQAIVENHENQPDDEYEGIDWEAVEGGEMDTVAVNESNGSDNEDVLASNDQNAGNGGYDSSLASNHRNEGANDYSSNNSDHDFNYGNDSSGEAPSDDMAYEDSNADDYDSTDYGNEDYGSEDYGSEDYGSDDYGVDTFDS